MIQPLFATLPSFRRSHARRHFIPLIPLAIWCIVTLMSPASAFADFHLWTTTCTIHVLRDDPPADNRAVHLYAARNETRDFQILFQSDVPETGINLVPGDLSRQGGGAIAAADATLYRQQQVHLQKASSRNDQFKPGFYPDALIPFVDPTTHQPLGAARFRAVPFDLPANQTHGFWVDIHLPPHVPSGDYTGQYQLIRAGQPPIDIPVTVTVYDFALPRTPTLQTCFGSPLPHLHRYYDRLAKSGRGVAPKDYSSIEEQVNRLMADHLINAAPVRPFDAIKQSDGRYKFTADELERLRRFVDDYHVNAIAVPRPDYVVDDPEKQKSALHAWLAEWNYAAAVLDRPWVVFYTYLYDEPNTAKEYEFVRKWGTAVRDAQSVVKVMTTEQTKPQEAAWGNLYGAVDIWTSLFSLYDPATAAARQHLGETLWTYTALTQGKPTPWWQIDYPLLNYRVIPWIEFHNHMRGLLYWGGMAYWDDVADPWSDPVTFFEPKKNPTEIWNGEGVLVYPAHDVGYDGIVPSIRLKAIRDSIEDYEYCAILERAGRRDEADKIVAPLAGSFFKWETDPAKYDAARDALARLIIAPK